MICETGQHRWNLQDECEGCTVPRWCVEDGWIVKECPGTGRNSTNEIYDFPAEQPHSGAKK